jgi:uncharacterized protein with ATP-grasp and redox domains
MALFRHLQNPESYLPGLWDLRVDHDIRGEWLTRLRHNIRDMVRFLAESEDAHLVARAERARSAWERVLGEVEIDPAARERHPTVLDLVRERDRGLREAGIEDLYRTVKARENAAALVVLEQGLSLDAGSLEAAVARVLAGNVFDMASPRVTEALASADGLASLEAHVNAKAPAVDDTGAAAEFLEGWTGTALVLVDNAGGDFVVGTLSLARWLLDRGGSVILAANEHPALNDVIATEAVALVDTVAARDAVIADAWRSGRLRVVSSGNAAAGIDFRDVPDAFNEAIVGVDFLAIVGQGRAIEGGWRAVFDIPSLRLATLKSPLVAAKLGLEPFDAIVRFCVAGEPA